MDGAVFAVSGRDGDLRPGADPPHGLFARDTRMLSRWELRVDGAPLQVLAVEEEGHLAAIFTGVPPPSERHGSAALVVVRHRTVAGGALVEEVTLRNHRATPRRVVVELAVDTDFADVFELKDAEARRRTIARTPDGGGLTIAYGAAGFSRTTHVTATGPAQAGPDGFAAELYLPPGGEAALTFTAREGDPAPAPAFAVAAGERRAERAAWLAAAPRLETDWPPLARAWARGLEDLAALRLPGEVPAAGLPWFMTLFGRDAILTSLFTLPVLPGFAAGTLEALARHQRDDGKIAHELREGETVMRGERPFGPSYATVDATPLFLVLLEEHTRWGGDPALARALEPTARAALGWIARERALRPDGWLGHPPGVPPDLVNQSWKDSPTSMRWADGRLAAGHLAPVEVQGYLVDALTRTARLAADAWGDPEIAADLAAEADALRSRLDADFWLPDRACFALALDGEGRPVDARTSNAGHLLWSGAVDRGRLAPLAATLTSPGLFTGWGVRTLSADDAPWDPVSYHEGSVWPHDAAIVAAGLARAGEREAAGRIAVALLEAADALGGALPEVLCGFPREGGPPVVFPTSCAPQAWAAAAPFLLVRALLGLEPGGVTDPALPPPIGRLELG